MALSGADYAQAHVWFTQAAEVWEQLGDKEQLALVWNNLGYVAQMNGDIPEARRRYESSLVIHRNAGDQRSIAVGLYNLAELALAEGNTAAAAICLNECLDIFVDIGDRYLLTYALRGAAAVAGVHANWHASITLWSASERLREDLEAPIDQMDQQSLDRGLELARNATTEDDFQADWNRGRHLALEETVQSARAVFTM
jgi:tetratricopeptide (TPR) repeat protein